MIDKNGRLLAERIQQAMRRLVPRLKRQWPFLRDDAVVHNMVEQAGQRVSEHESKKGPSPRLHGLAWTTLRRLAISWARTPAAQFDVCCEAMPEGEFEVMAPSTREGSPERTYQAVLLHELLRALTTQERVIYAQRLHGFSSAEVAQALGLTRSNVDVTYSRARARLRDLQRGH